MSYEIDVDPEAQLAITALPRSALLALAEAMAFLELTPWNGRPINPDNPKGEVRTLAFGEVGLLTYLVLEDQRRVDILAVAWAA